MPWSRRRTLAALATGVTAGLAGCNSGSERRRSVPGDDRRRIDYELEEVRNTDGAVLFSRSAEDLQLGDGTATTTVADDGGDDQRTTDPEARERERLLRYARNQRHYLTESDEFADLAFADVPEAETLRAFGADTDFETESLYLFASEVAACYEQRLTAVTVDDGPHTQFCRELRPADVECDADANHTVGFAVRLAVPGDEHSGTGSGMRNSCDGPDRPQPFDPDADNGSEGS